MKCVKESLQSDMVSRFLPWEGKTWTCASLLKSSSFCFRVTATPKTILVKHEVGVTAHLEAHIASLQKGQAWSLRISVVDFNGKWLEFYYVWKNWKNLSRHLWIESFNIKMISESVTLRTEGGLHILYHNVVVYDSHKRMWSYCIKYNSVINISY